MFAEVFIPFYNSDMTEGRGSMIPKPFGFSHRKDAEDYIDKQSGIMGRKAKWSMQPYGDWEIRVFAICDSLEEVEKTEESVEFNKLMSKLTDREKEILRKNLSNR